MTMRGHDLSHEPPRAWLTLGRESGPRYPRFVCRCFRVLVRRDAQDESSGFGHLLCLPSRPTDEQSLSSNCRSWTADKAEAVFTKAAELSPGARKCSLSTMWLWPPTND